MPSPRELLNEILSTPREAGTPDTDRVRALLRQYLEGLGYRVEQQHFGFSPTTLLAFPLLGAGLGWLGLLELPLLVLPTSPGASSVVWFASLLALAALVYGLGMGWTPPATPLRHDANLIATRGDGPVRRWIVAHIDSKAQGHSMAGRLVAVWTVALAIGVMTALVLLRLRGPLVVPAAAGGSLLTVGAGALAGRGKLRGTSRGARDNGTGLYAALLAAGASQDPGTGLLLTSAEEFGLIGARAFAGSGVKGLADSVMVNLDTLDDSGRLFLVYHDHRGKGLAQEEATRLAGLGTAPVIRHLPAGILVDSVVFAKAGIPAVTLSRLDWGTLRVMHTPGDTPDGMAFETAERVGRIVGLRD